MTTPIDPIREALNAIDFLEIPDVEDESGIDTYYSPQLVLECIEAALKAKDAEIEALRATADEDEHVIERLSKLLAGVAIALKGDELPLHRHSYHDLADVADATKLELDLYRATFPNGIPAATLDAALKEPS